MSALYYGEMKRRLSRRLVALTTTTGVLGLASVGGATAQFVRASDGMLQFLAPTLVVFAAACSAYIQSSKLPERIGRATELVGSWKLREAMWAEAWERFEETGERPEDLAAMRRDEASLSKEESEFPREQKLIERLQADVERSLGLS